MYCWARLSILIGFSLRLTCQRSNNELMLAITFLLVKWNRFCFKFLKWYKVRTYIESLVLKLIKIINYRRSVKDLEIGLKSGKFNMCELAIRKFVLYKSWKLENIVQVWIDELNINLFLKKRNDRNGKQLVNVGVCGLHIISIAIKDSTAACLVGSSQFLRY